jgi:hypothetical protein
MGRFLTASQGCLILVYQLLKVSLFSSCSTRLWTCVRSCNGRNLLWAACLLADECPNSADDSDDDVITNYLVLCEGTGPPMANKHGGPGPLVPTISVTPHSPGAKHYPVLGECNRVTCLLGRIVLHCDPWTFILYQGKCSCGVRHDIQWNNTQHHLPFVTWFI